MSDPMLFGTQMDYAWDAWKKASSGSSRPASNEEFKAWWDGHACTTHWTSLYEMMHAAWNAGAQEGFTAWWQGILDSQPVHGFSTPSDGGGSI